MIVISHPTGNQNLRNTVEAFYKAGQLTKLFTTVAWNNQSVLNKILPVRLTDTLRRREYGNIPTELITNHPNLEYCRLLCSKLKLKRLTEHETGIFSVDRIYYDLDNFVARRLPELTNLQQLYAYEDGSLNSFRRAKTLNIECLYELPIGYWRAAQTIMGEEAQLKPAWANTILSMRDSPYKLARKDQELELADKIITASRFTAETLKLSPAQNKSVLIIPYGSPLPINQPNLRTSKKLKVLFVGGLSQRKGLSYLLDAVAILKDKIQLTIIGSRIAPCKPLDEALNNYRYIKSLPHHEILTEMADHDVLVFPSLFEGFGLVILEAMSRGLPVITTSHTAGPDIIQNGHDGFIIPIRSYEAIAEKLETLAKDPDLLNQVKTAALQKARIFSWQHYQNQLLQLIT